MPTAPKSPDRITIRALQYYVPLFQQGDLAEQKILEKSSALTLSEQHHLETVMKLKDLAARKIAMLAAPLITRELNKIIAGSHLRDREDLFDLLYYAGIDGMKRGLRRFDVDKINASSTNYLFQWIVTYAKKELVMLEAPFGIPPSRFQRYKKISAVRKRMSEVLGRYATNEEVLDYFQSGKADLQTMNGRVADKGKMSQANKNITLELVEEQERFEKEMLTVDLLDPLEDYSTATHLSTPAEIPFAETLFGVFVSTYNVTDEARVVLMSELNSSSLSDDEVALLQDLTQKEYKNLSNQWKNLVKDVDGPFYAFLKTIDGEGFQEFDVKSTIAAIEAHDKTINSALYRVLFEEDKVMQK